MGNTEPELDIRNTGNARCMLCNTGILAQFDRDLFFRKYSFDDFLPKANALGYSVPQADFNTHLKHIYVFKKPDIQPNSNSTEIIGEMIGSLRAQLTAKEASDETGDSEYTKKSELLKSLIELKGKFDGSYAKNSETTTSFKDMLQNQVRLARDGEARKVDEIAAVADQDLFSQALELSKKAAPVPVGKV